MNESHHPWALPILYASTWCVEPLSLNQAELHQNISGRVLNSDVKHGQRCAEGVNTVVHKRSTPFLAKGDITNSGILLCTLMRHFTQS